METISSHQLDEIIYKITGDIRLADALQKQKEWKELTHHIIQGKIVGRVEGGYEIKLFAKDIIGFLPDRQSVKHDNYEYEKIFWFYIDKILLKKIEDNYFTQLILNRKSFNLLKYLLQKTCSPEAYIRVIRHPGIKSFIYSNTFIKKEEIKLIGSELGEKIIFQKNFEKK